MEDFKPRLCCRSCQIQHIENCPECYGFGMAAQPFGVIPGTTPTMVVRAGEALEFRDSRTRPRGAQVLLNCEVCGSGIGGAASLPLPV